MEAHDDELVRRLAQLCGKPPHLIEHVIAQRRSRGSVEPSEADRRPIRTSSQSANAWVHAGRKSSQSSEADDRLIEGRLIYDASSMRRPSKPEPSQSSEADEAAQLLAEQEALPSAPLTLPSAPVDAPPGPSAVPAAVRAQAESAWCHICRANAWVWCADCDNAAFCAKCWRETHAQSWSGDLRKHRTVKCTETRVNAALPSAPVQPAGLPSRRPAPLIAKPKTPQCTACTAAAHVWCSGCDDEPYCAKCWRETHAQSWSGDLRKHRTVKLRA